MYQPTPDIEDEEIDLGDLLGVLIENRWLIIAITFVALLMGTYKAFTAVPIYQADGMLQVEEKKSGLGDLDISGLLGGGDSPISAEIEILRSRSVLGTVVDNLQLDIYAEPDLSTIGAALARRSAPSARPKIQIDTLDLPASMLGQSLTLIATTPNKYELLNETGESLLHGTVGETATKPMPGGEAITLFVSSLQGDKDQSFTLARESRIDSLQSLQGSMSVSERGDWSGILSISVEGTDPDSVRRQVNEIANVYVRQNVERKSAEAKQTLDFLDEQLPIVRLDMETSELALNTYRLEKGSIDLPLETQTILQTIVSVEAQLNELQQQREKTTLAFTPSHPMIIGLDRQIERLNAELAGLNEQVRDLPTTQQEVLRPY